MQRRLPAQAMIVSTQLSFAHPQNPLASSSAPARGCGGFGAGIYFGRPCTLLEAELAHAQAKKIKEQNAMWLWVKNRVTPKWLALVSGNMDQNLWSDSWFNFDNHTHMHPSEIWSTPPQGSRLGHVPWLLSEPESSHNFPALSRQPSF